MCLFRFVISHAATITANNLMRHCKKHLPTQNNKLWILGVISKFSFFIFLAYSPLLTQTCTQTLTVQCSKNYFWHSFCFLEIINAIICFILWSTVIIHRNIMHTLFGLTVYTPHYMLLGYLHIASGPGIYIFSQDSEHTT